VDVGGLKGDSLERKYRERPFVYFRRILRKPKVLTDSELDDLLSQAQASGALTEAEVEEISRLDAIVRGRHVADDRTVYLAVEISAKIDARDVERAAKHRFRLNTVEIEATNECNTRCLHARTKPSPGRKGR
jgi:hypothetical protein